MTKHGSQDKVQIARFLPYLLLIAGAIGFLSSFMLSVEKYQLLKDPAYHPICNLNPIFSCSSVASTPQAAIFGFPNMLIGIGAFAMVMVAGAAMLAGGTMKPWFWRLFNLGTLGGIIFVHWLQSQSIYVINALCLYCMVVWAVMAPIFWYTTLYNLQQGHLSFGKRLQGFATGLLKYHDIILASWYGLVIFAILQHFWDFFSTIL